MTITIDTEKITNALKKVTTSVVNGTKTAVTATIDASKSVGYSISDTLQDRKVKQIEKLSANDALSQETKEALKNTSDTVRKAYQELRSKRT